MQAYILQKMKNLVLLTNVESLCARRSNRFGVEENVTVKEGFAVFFSENTGI